MKKRRKNASGRSDPLPGAKKRSSRKWVLDRRENRRRFEIISSGSPGLSQQSTQSKNLLLDRMFDGIIPPRIIPVPEHFCLKTNPRETLDFLGALSHLLLNERCRNIFISHKRTKTLGLEASYLFDLEIRKAIAINRKNNQKLKITGEISDSRSVNNALLAFGLLGLLKINTTNLRADLFDKDYGDKYEVIHMYGSQEVPTANGSASLALARYFNRCLKFNGLQLTEPGREKIVAAASEIIDNAEEHSQTPDPWIVLGRYEKETQNCSYSIISTGRTIYESLSAPESTARDVLEKVQEVVSSHTPLWEKLKAAGGLCTQTEENIWNVMALQEGISSKKSETGDDYARGQGMMDFMEIIEAISDGASPRPLAIVSGASYILQDFSYPIRRVPIRNSTKTTRQISFNSANLHQPADSKCVYALSTHYKGVIISGVFKVRGSLLEAATKQRQEVSWR